MLIVEICSKVLVCRVWLKYFGEMFDLKLILNVCLEYDNYCLRVFCEYDLINLYNWLIVLFGVLILVVVLICVSWWYLFWL